MFRCKKCGETADLYFEICPTCGEPLSLCEEEADLLRAAIRTARRAKEAETVYYYRRILAEAGDAESGREYGKLIERGEVAAPAGAAEGYYRRAAGRNDAEAAFLLGRLLDRRQEVREASFWIRFAALLDCAPTYPACAKLLLREKDFPRADYYLVRAALLDDRASLLALALHRAERDPAEAKWCLDRLGVPPLSAVRLAFRLRNCAPAAPALPPFPDRRGYLTALCEEAEAFGLSAARFALLSMRAKEGDEAALCPLAEAYANGNGTAPDPAAAVRFLRAAVESGSAGACLLLGDLYSEGRIVTQSFERAAAFYEAAALRGEPAGYEKLGALYEREGPERDIGRAVSAYEKAAAVGRTAAKEKADAYRQAREEAFRAGLLFLEEGRGEEAFAAFCEAADLGLPDAELCLGECREYAIGADRNRRLAFGHYRRAAEAGVTEALYPLGRCYAEGIGVRRDSGRAEELFRLSAGKGDGRAAAALNELSYRKLKAALRGAYGKAMRLLHIGKYSAAAELLLACEAAGDPKILYTLGCLAEFGKGLPEDRERAAGYYAAARAAGFSDPGAAYKRAVLKQIR